MRINVKHVPPHDRRAPRPPLRAVASDGDEPEEHALAMHREPKAAIDPAWAVIALLGLGGLLVIHSELKRADARERFKVPPMLPPFGVIR